MNHLACQGITPQASKLSPSREVSSFPTKLVKGDKGPMGPKHNSGLPDGLLLDSTSTCNTLLSTILCTSDIRGGDRITTEGCNRGSSTSRANRFYLNLFLVPKKDGRQCQVINLKTLNNFVNKEHFKMEGIHTLKDLLKRGDWLAKIDLKDAFFSIPINPNHKKFLRFMFQGNTYQLNCLPFGLSSAPWVFTKTLETSTSNLPVERSTANSLYR